MISARVQIVPRYVETDQSGEVAHARFLSWFDLGRAALLKAQGFDYRRFEEEGFWMPVLEVGLTLHAPAYYDDVLTLDTVLSSRPSFRIRLEYEIRRDDTLLVSGFTTQGFINRRQRPVRPPADFMARVDLVFPREQRAGPAAQNSTAGP